jgi:filamentous hemagglutinin family protein
MRTLYSIALALPAVAICLPQACETIAGAAVFDRSERALSVVASDLSILEWGDFSIEENGEVRFILPDSKASVLNRAIDARPSRIFGTLSANGNLLLVNPSGIVFGEKSQIDAASFIASTLDLLNDDFIKNGQLSFFSKSSGSIDNSGAIEARSGDVYLVGRSVQHRGKINAGEDVGLISASKTVLALENGHWKLIGAMGEAGDFSYLSGEVTSRNAFVLGEWVELQNGARIDVSSNGSAGSVWIGGSLRGESREIIHAKRTYVDAGASILADGINGGKIIVWADEALSCRGRLSARGGDEGGDGGFVEVSCPRTYDFLASVDTRAPNGVSGTLLMDPTTITISAAANANVAFGGGCGALTYCSPGAAANVQIGAVGMPGTLLDNLSMGNVTIDSIQGAGGTGNISFTAAMVWATTPVGGSTLTLNAFGNISNTAGSPITNNTLNGSIVLNAGAGGGVGSATIGGAITYMAGSSNNLTISANNGVTINAAVTVPTTGSIAITDNSATGITFSNAVQNGSSGSVIVTENGAGPVRVGTGLEVVDISVGSQNGLTQFTALNSTITLQSRLAIGGITAAQIGFFTPAGGVSSGPIAVACNALTINGGGGNTASQIGHGRGRLNVNTATTNTATINVLVTGNINLNAQQVENNDQSVAWIGHGSRQFDGAMSCDQDGDISVVSRTGNISLNQGGLFNVNRGRAIIGHGCGQGYAVGGVPSNISGNITVQACLGSIFLLSQTSAQSNTCMIGHGNVTRYEGTTFNTIIDVSCAENLQMSGQAPNNQSILIGCSSGAGSIQTLNQDVRVVARGNIQMDASQRTLIGCQFSTPALTEVFNGDVEVAAGGNITMTNTGVMIGVTQVSAMPMGYNLLHSDTSVAAGGSITINCANDFGGNFSSIENGGNVSVAALGNIFATAGAGSVNIGTSNRDSNLGSSTTRIYAAGNIIATQGNPGLANLGYEANDLLAPPSYNIDIRAGGDIQMGNDVTGGFSTLGGSIFIQADSDFPTGGLWTFGGAAPAGTCNPGGGQPTLISICGLPLGLPVTNAYFLPFNTNSPNLPAIGEGAFYVSSPLNVPANNITLETTTGNITVNSACSRVNGTPQALRIGTSNAENLNIVTIDGDITISGSVCGDAFHDVTIVSIANPWTTGSILVRACDFLNVNDIVATIGTGSSITLIGDNNGDGTGDLNINANIQTMDGPISLSAGLLGSNCLVPGVCARVNGSSANINHASGTFVQCLLAGGTILETASGSINLDNATVQTIDGSIHMLAGVDVNINSLIRNTSLNPAGAGEIILVAGKNVRLRAPNPPAFPNPSIISSPNPVTLVADNDFPAAPLSGSGAITMVAGSAITGSPLQLFASQQSFNSLLGTLNSNAFSGGTLFTDTLFEQWCTYFNCPAQRALLGIPYTVFYKNCLEGPKREADVIVSQLLENLHPYDEYPGWIEEFFFQRRIVSLYDLKDPYMIRRRNLQGFNHPKSWTAVMSEGRFDEKNSDKEDSL